MMLHLFSGLDPHVSQHADSGNPGLSVKDKGFCIDLMLLVAGLDTEELPFVSCGGGDRIVAHTCHLQYILTSDRPTLPVWDTMPLNYGFVSLSSRRLHFAIVD